MDLALLSASRAQVERQGYALLPQAVHTAACAALTAQFEIPTPRDAGRRNLLRGLADLPALRLLERLAQGLTQGPARAVRAILFDKSTAANWGVAWHRDLGIALHERHETPGFRNWSLKEGVWHAQPPIEVLRGMLTLRLHLDACDAGSGALHVVPGSHRPEHPDAPVAGTGSVCCAACAGDVLAMRPTLLHASYKAAIPQRRRVLHVEYATTALPAPLQWAAA